MEHEMGDIVDAVVKQADDTCETDTIANNVNTFDIIQEGVMGGTDKGVMEGVFSGRKDANLNAIRLLASQSVISLENNNSGPVIISTFNEDTSCEHRETNDDDTRRNAILRSIKTIDDGDITEMNHEIKDSDKAGVSRERMVINNYTSIKRLKRKPIRLIDTQQKENSTATSNSLH